MKTALVLGVALLVLGLSSAAEAQSPTATASPESPAPPTDLRLSAKLDNPPLRPLRPLPRWKWDGPDSGTIELEVSSTTSADSRDYTFVASLPATERDQETFSSTGNLTCARSRSRSFVSGFVQSSPWFWGRTQNSASNLAPLERISRPRPHPSVLAPLRTPTRAASQPGGGPP